MARFFARDRVLARATLHRRGRMGEEQPCVLNYYCVCNCKVFDTNSLHFNLFNTRLKCFIIHSLDILLQPVYVPRKAT
jgi:hypothetical protein